MPPAADTPLDPRQDATIHPSAIVSSDATIEPGVTVGPRCTIEGPVTLRAGVTLIGDVHITGDTEIGAGTMVYPYACIGFGPQHIKIKPGDPVGGVRIGADCTIREHATIHAAMHEGAHTVLGDRDYIMVAGHIGHDCVLGDDVIVCNSAQVAGHCEIADKVYISGNVSVHQFVRIGRGAMLSGGTQTGLDIPPYAVLAGRNVLAGLNLVGMRRAGIPREEITRARAAYRGAFRRGVTRAEQLAQLDEHAESSEVAKMMADFVRASSRGIASARPRPRHAADIPGDDDGLA